MRNEINTSALSFVKLPHDLKRRLLGALRRWIRQRFGATAGDEARRFNRLDEAVTAYENYLKWVPRDLGVQLRLAGVLRDAGRSDEAAVRLEGLAKGRRDKVKIKLALADTLDEIGAVDRARAIYRSVLDHDTSNVFAREALRRIANAATVPELAPPVPPLAKRGVRRLNLRIIATGASARSIMATVQSVQSASNVAWSVSVLGFEGELPEVSRLLREVGESDCADDEAGELCVEAGELLKPGALDWLLWAIDQGAMAAYGDHEDGSGTAMLQSAPNRFDLDTNPAPPSLAIFRGATRESILHVSERLAQAMSLGGVMHIPLVLSKAGPARPLCPERAVGKGGDDQILVVIPTRDAVSDLTVMVRSLIRLAAQPKLLEVVVVDNGSRQRLEPEMFADACDVATISVMRIDEPFNWSRLNNRACEGRHQPIIVFANNDMEMLADGWDDHLRSLLRMDHVGVVGARLLYPNGLLQHGGIVMGGFNGEPLHDGWRAGGGDAGPLGRWRRRRPATAVTGGFMAVRRSLFEAVGGFDDVHLPISCSDVDLCLKVGALGWTVLYAPEIELRHHESLTRGHAQDDVQRRRAETEMAVLLGRWESRAAYDPTRNPQWETRGVRLYAGRRPLTTDQVVDWSLKTASRPAPPPQDTPTMA